MTELQQAICTFAISNLGQKEKPNNSGFLNAHFETQMKSVGFDKGESWCCLFAELCWTEAFKVYQPDLVDKVSKLFSESCMKTWGNANEQKVFQVELTPVPGAVAIFRHGSGWTGHAAIVTSYDLKDKDFFRTIEGNTNAAGGREGIEVARKRRALDFTRKANQLNLQGFIYPFLLK